MRSIVACLVVFAGSSRRRPRHRTHPSHDGHGRVSRSLRQSGARTGRSSWQVADDPDKTLSMPEHFLVLRHQEGDDWDYVVIQHLGPKAEVTATPPPPPTPASPQRVAQRYVRQRTLVGRVHQTDGDRRFAMRLPWYTSSAFNARSPAIASTHEILDRSRCGEQDRTGNVLLQHVEGSEWTFATITRTTLEISRAIAWRPGRRQCDGGRLGRHP